MKQKAVENIMRAIYRDSSVSRVIDVIDEHARTIERFDSSRLSRDNVYPTAAGCPAFNLFPGPERAAVYTGAPSATPSIIFGIIVARGQATLMSVSQALFFRRHSRSIGTSRLFHGSPSRHGFSSISSGISQAPGYSAVAT